VHLGLTKLSIVERSSDSRRYCQRSHLWENLTGRKVAYHHHRDWRLALMILA